MSLIELNFNEDLSKWEVLDDGGVFDDFYDLQDAEKCLKLLQITTKINSLIKDKITDVLEENNIFDYEEEQEFFSFYHTYMGIDLRDLYLGDP